MRDPNRISEVLKKLEEVWRLSPDLRLGQLVVGATNLSGKKVICPEVFYLEDEDLIRGIEAYLTAIKKGPNQPPEAMPVQSPPSKQSP